MNQSPNLTSNNLTSNNLTSNHSERDRQRLRIRFRKEGDLRWIGHRDLLRTFERLFRRAGLSLRMSEGFHPKPRLSFPTALALGVEGWDEVMELQLDPIMNPVEVKQRINAAAPTGLIFCQVEDVGTDSKKAQVRRMSYQFPVPEDRRTDVQKTIDDLQNGQTLSIHRPDKELPANAIADLESVTWQDGAVHFHIRASRTASIRPRDVLAALGLTELGLTELGLTELEQRGYHLVRTGVELADAAKLASATGESS